MNDTKAHNRDTEDAEQTPRAEAPSPSSMSLLLSSLLSCVSTRRASSHGTVNGVNGQ